jgi:PAS domain-containing protein
VSFPAAEGAEDRDILRSAFDSSSVGIVVLDDDLRVVDANPAITGILKIPHGISWA